MLSSKEIAKKWETIANGKAALPIWKQLLLSVLAGMFIAFGALGSTVASGAVGGGLGKLLGACVFPAGLILVVMAGAELFTGNCLMAGPVSNGKLKISRMLLSWLVVYLGNMLGSFLMALLISCSGFLEQAGVCAAAASAAFNKCSLSFGAALARGVGCNILVCGAVWMASGADSAGGKAVCCFFPVMLFVLCGFEHSVANMYYIPLGIIIRNLQTDAALPEGFMETVNIGNYLLKNLLPVTLGNIIGGAGLAIVYAKTHKD